MTPAFVHVQTLTLAAVESAAYGFLLAGFAAFIIYCRVFGIFGRETYYSIVGKTHLAFCGLTIVGFIGWCLANGAEAHVTASHAMAIAILFFLLHYGFFHPLIGLIKKSVSLGLMMQLWDRPGSSAESLAHTYADGRGTQYLVDSRIQQMRALGWIEGEGSYRITMKGISTTRMYRRLKGFFGLKTPFEKLAPTRSTTVPEVAR